MKKRISILTAIILISGITVFITSCKKDDPPAIATTVELVSGGSQTGVVGNDLDDPIVVVVKDQSGNAFPGAAITFSVTEGSVSPASATSNASGNASVIWTLGNTAGTQTLTATVTGIATPLTINATAGALTASTIELVSGGGQSEMTEGTLENDIVVVVKDQNGDLFAGASITFAVTEGSVSPTSATTNASGNATTSWTLGTTEGTQTLTISGATTPLTVDATGTYRPVIGDFKFGGVIFYIDGTGEHGLVCAISDQSLATLWGCQGTPITGADGEAIGDGTQNTLDIEAECDVANTAADLCANLNLNEYTDWFLPSLGELEEMQTIRDEINTALGTIDGGVSISSYYWSSTEFSNDAAYVVNLSSTSQSNAPKDDNTVKVRAVRSF